MRRAWVAVWLVGLFSSGHWFTHSAGQDPPAPRPAVPELMKREVSREGVGYLEELRKNRTPFGTHGFDLKALRAGMGSRREPTIKDVRLVKVQAGEVPCEWVLAPGADPDVRLLYIHGGGFVSGSGGFYLAQAAHISKAAKCAILLPDYRLAPEHPFPAGLDDCVLTHKWMGANGPSGAAPARATFVAGDSAGGSLTLATLLALRDRRMTLPMGGIAISPTTDLTLASDSLKTVGDPILSAKTMPVFRAHYLGRTDPTNPLASPVFGDYRGLPPLLIQCGEHEMLRDDSIRAAKKARADGIAVTLEVWPGMFHVFHSHEPLLPEAREAIDHIAAFMRSATDAPDLSKATLPAGLVAKGTVAAPAAVVCFLEGPAVDAAGNVFFSDIAGNRILRMDAKGVTTTFRADSGRTNGNCFDAAGRLVSCEGGEQGPGRRRVVRTDLKTGEIAVLTERYDGKRYNSPNDCCVDGRGRVWFTDPRYGADRTDLEMDVEAVYCIDTAGKVERVRTQKAIDRPNGVAVSPDDKTLYVIDSHPRVGGNRRVWAFDLAADGSLSGQRVVYDFGTGRGGDGMRVDVSGNLWVAAGINKPRGNPGESLDVPAGVYVISPAGKLLGRVPVPEDLVTNVAFGGPALKTLYVTAGKTLYRFPVNVSGYAVYPPLARE